MDIQRNINMIMHSMRLDGYNDFENSIDYREAIGMFTFPWGPKKYSKSYFYCDLDNILTRMQSHTSCNWRITD